MGISEREKRLSKQKTNIGGCMKICKSDMVGLKCIQTSCLRSILHEIKSSQTCLSILFWSRTIKEDLKRKVDKFYNNKALVSLSNMV